MATSLMLALALIQAPAAPHAFSPSGAVGEYLPLVEATKPTLAPRPATPAPILAIRTSSTDAWGCAYGSSYYCRHSSAVVGGAGILPIPTLDPCPWTGECVALYPTGSSFNAGRFVAWQERWGPSIEFVQTNRGLIDGKAIMEARAREAAARNGTRSSLQTPARASGAGGTYTPSTPSYGPPPPSTGGGKPAPAGGRKQF